VTAFPWKAERVVPFGTMRNSQKGYCGITPPVLTQTDWVNSIAAPKYVLSASGAQSTSVPVRTGTNTFVLMDAPLLNRIAVRGKMSPFGVPLVM
jgi:hypothetical protein